MYDPKFSQKQMYDQYGRSRQTKKEPVMERVAPDQPEPSRPSTFDQFKRRETNRGLGSKPRTFGGGQDNNPNRDEAENKSTVKKVFERAVDLFKSFGADEPKDVIVDGKRVYQGPLFRGFTPTIPTENFGGEFGKQQYLFGAESLGIFGPGIKTTRSPVPPTLPPGTVNRLGVNTDNPRLNMFGVNRGFTKPPASPELPTITPQPQIPEAISVPIEEDYTIEVGDTLSEIAEKRGTTVDVLLEMNDNIEDKDKIYAGDKLKVPTKKLTNTQAALRRGLGSKKNISGIQVASSDPMFAYYQSQVPMDKRIFEPEIGYDEIPQVFADSDIEEAKPIIAIENSLSDDDLGIPDTDNYMGYIPLTPAQKILDKISVGEGATPEGLQRQESLGIGTTPYDMVLAYGSLAAPDKPITQMTLQEVFDFQKELIKASKGKLKGTKLGSSAVGKYQVIKSQLFGPKGTPAKPQKNYWADKLKLTPDMIYTPALQEKIGRLILKEAGYDNYLKGKKSQKNLLKGIASKWASVEGNDYGQPIKTSQAELAPILDTVQPDYISLGTR